MKKRIAVALMALMLSMGAGSGRALTMTGLETETGRDWMTSRFFVRMEEQTGVAVQAEGITDVKAYAKKLEALTDTDVLFKANLTRAQEYALLNTGAIVDLAPWIDQCMPNLSALLAEHPDWREAITLEDGRIASLPLLNLHERQAMMWMNRAWLEKLNLTMPETVAELGDTLEKMTQVDLNENGKQDETGADLIGVYEMRWLLPYFGIVADDYNLARDENGQVVFAPELPAYRTFVETLCDWKARGILRKDAFTAVHSTAETGNAGGLLFSMTPYTHVSAEQVTDYVPLLMAGPDDRVRWRDLLGEVWTGCMAVTCSCENIEEALIWADALYTEEGAKLAYAGVEGADYTVNDKGLWSFTVSEGRTMQSIRNEDLMYTGTAMPGLYPGEFIEQVNSPLDRYVFEQTAKVRAVSEGVTWAYSLLPEEQERANTLAMKIGEKVDTGIARFVTGEIPLNDETWTAWLEMLKETGSAELTTLFQNP